MERRNFIKKSIGAGIAIGVGLNTGIAGNLSEINRNAYDLVAIKGGEAEDMFKKGIASLGGMKSFVKPNQTVVVKPNIGWDTSPEKGADTNPNLIYEIIKHCYDAGAKKVYVFDNTCNNWQKCYKNSGIEDAVKNAGGVIVTGKDEGMYQEVELKNAKILSKTKLHELILSSDVFINVPVLKNHSSTTVSCAMKNLMGTIWDRKFFHKNGLSQCIADCPTYRKPDLNIVDAYRVMKTNGPRGISPNDCITMKAQLISTDIVAVDTAAVKLFGINPEDITYLSKGQSNGLGTMDLKSLNIYRISI